MRISDWSSDVCSSDLVAADGDVAAVDAELDLEAVAPNAAAAARVEQQLETGAELLADPIRNAADLDRGEFVGGAALGRGVERAEPASGQRQDGDEQRRQDRKSTRLNSSH